VPLNANIRLTISVLIMQAKLLLKYGSDLRIVLVGFLFYASACLGYFLTFENTSTLPAWPPSGIAFALIILMGRSVWPGIMIGALLANLMAHWNNASLSVHSAIALSCMTAMANTIEALVGNFLTKQWIGNDYPFRNARNAFQFLFVTLLMCMAGAVLGTSGLFMTDVVGANGLWKTALSWWVGNVVGILLFTPLILSVNYFRHFRFSSEKALEVGVFLLFAVGLILLFQFNTLNPTMEHALPFLILPFLLWLAFRFELMIAMAGVLQVSLLSIYVTIQGAGPFVLDKPYYSMLLLQIYIGVTSVSTIVLSATVKERMEAQRALLQFNETLEAKVQERTRALNDEISIRREAEEKLQNTNYELSKRNTELDNFVYSVSHDLRAPIASVLGLINLAKKDSDPEMKDLYLDMISNSAKQQDHFIREILDQSRNSRLEIKREEVYFEPIIEETFHQLRLATAASQPVEKIINIRQEKPFYCDRWRLKVILNNIISNAIRYRNGKDPVIRVNVEVDSRCAKVEIEDNGKGIGKEHLGNLCKMFYRATDDGAGSGLGLYIVKETIDKLNGSIDIDSEIGRGTMVKLNIPEVLN
jgi:signal transduction histidine kinase